MMGWLKNLSIPRKIVAIAMIITVSALLLAGVVLTGYDFLAAKRDLQAGTTVFARIIADNVTAAVEFNDQAAAMDTLASLRAEPSIVSACIYKGTELFAERMFGGDFACPRQLRDDVDQEGFVGGTSSIVLQGKQIGKVRLLASTSSVYGTVRVAVIVLTLVLAASVLFALGLSSNLQRFISTPILDLAQTARTVSGRKDYSLRAVKQSEDELATLVDSFNEMLDQIQSREAELIHANKMKDEFLTTLSHELRTPLTPILGWTKLLLQRDFDAARARVALQTIDRSAELQARLIEDLLDVARIMTGKWSMDLSEVDLRQVIELAVQSAIPAAKEKGLALEAALEPVPVIQGNATRLQQVMWNLLSNAMKFTPGGGTIRVTLRGDGRSVVVTVSDTGVGIERAFLPYVFERFRQADSSHTRVHGGLGLGLAIVKHVVEQHGGTITVYSSGENKGTRFVLVLPVLRSASGSTQATAINASDEIH